MAEEAVVGPRRMADFQEEKSPESTRASRAVDWVVASPEAKFMELAMVWSSVAERFLGVGASAVLEEEEVTSFPIS